MVDLDKRQRELCDVIKDDMHAIGTGSPGSGKSAITNTVMEENPKTTIMLTYNRLLADSTRESIETKFVNSNVNRLVFTYHGLASSLFGKTIDTDLLLTRAIDDAENATYDEWEGRDFTLLIIDECQDMRPDYLRIIQLLLFQVATKRPDIHMLFIGDVQQVLYDFYPRSSADPRFLVGMHKLLSSVNNKQWRHVKLLNSYRLTSQMCSFINDIRGSNESDASCISSYQEVKSEREGLPVKVCVIDIYKDTSETVLDLIQKSTYAYKDILVVAPSMNTRSQATKVVEHLLNNNIPVCVYRSGQLQEVNITNHDDNNVVFRTFCSTKGDEAEFVIVINTRPLLTRMSNAQFVAITRAKKELVVLTHYRHISTNEIDRMKSIGVDIIQRRTVTQSPVPLPIKEPSFIPQWGNVNSHDILKIIDVHNMFAFIDVQHLSELMNMVQVVTIQKEDSSIHEDSIHADSIHAELLLCLLRYSMTQTLPYRLQRMLTLMSTKVSDTNRCSQLITTYLNSFRDILQNPLQIRQQMEGFGKAVLCLDATNGFMDKLMSIDQFDWANNDIQFERLQRLTKLVEQEISPSSIWSKSTREVFQVIDHKNKIVNIVIESTPIILNPNSIVHIVHRTAFTDTDILVACLMSCVAKVDTACLINSLTGHVMSIHLRTTPKNFITVAMNAAFMKSTPDSDQVFYEKFTKKV